MKNKIFISILTIALLLTSIDISYASVISSSDISKHLIYYVNSEESNLLCINLAKSNMSTNLEVIYSDEMAPLNKKNKYLRKYYYSKLFASNYMYQDNILIRSYNVASNISYVIKSIQYNKNKTITVNYKLNYLDSETQSAYVIEKINNDIKNNLSNLKTDYQKVKWAYQWVIDNTKYDFTIRNSSAYSGLTDKGTVCRGYALLYNIVLEKLGLNCRYVEGSINQSVDNNHAWNIIELDGKWYCSDTTWGDNVDFDKYFLKTKDIFATQEYEYHTSLLYDNYIDAGEIFSDTDYVENENSEIYGVLPSVYNIELDVLKINALNINESYNYMINNPDSIKINFISSKPTVAEVNTKGLIYGLTKGTTTITAYNKDLNFEQKIIITVE